MGKDPYLSKVGFAALADTSDLGWHGPLSTLLRALLPPGRLPGAERTATNSTHELPTGTRTSAVLLTGSHLPRPPPESIVGRYRYLDGPCSAMRLRAREGHLKPA